MTRGPVLRVGLIGTGRISDIYLETLAKYPMVEVTVCGSLNPGESRAKADRHGIARVASPEDIIADPDVDAILNLTIPAAHAEISLAALNAGKHVYSEKPIVADLEQGRAVLHLAKKRGLLVGNAPDTVLGGRWQCLRQLIDDGAIGRPTGAMAFVGTHGTERHNPNPDFYYQIGGGPMLDLGPYYLAAMHLCLGPIARVAGMSNRAFDRRMIENGPRHGDWMPVEVDTHVQGMLEFESGVIGSITMSFDIWDSETPRFEIYGTEGTLCISDPDPVHGANIFGGPIWLRQRETSRWTHQPRPVGREDWQEIQPRHGLTENSRGIGLVDLALALREGRAPRCSGEIAFHVLEVMEGILAGPAQGRFVDISSRPDRPSPLPHRFPSFS